MINVDVFSDEKAWSTKLKKKQMFFDEVCKSFPQKYKFLNKKISFSLMLSNILEIKINQLIFYLFLLEKKTK